MSSPPSLAIDQEPARPSTSLVATEPPPGGMLSAPTPGDDPFSKPGNARLVFRDEGLGLLTWSKNDGRADFAVLNYKANRDYESSSKAAITSDRPANAFTRHSIASGRVMSSEFDQCLVLHRQSVKNLGTTARVTWHVFNPGNYAKLPANAFTPFAFEDTIDTRPDNTHLLTPGALAVADLDGLVNAGGNSTDEVIVVRETTGRDLTLEVFNYAWGEPGVCVGAAIRLPNPLGFLPLLNETQRKPGAVVVKTGDFSGDGHRQILVVHHAGRRGNENETFIQAVIYDYAINAETRVGSLTLRDEIVVTPAGINTGLDVAVGDFLGASGVRTVGGLKLGLGREQVAVAHHQDARAAEHGHVIANLIVSFLDRDPSLPGGKITVRHHHRITNLDTYRLRFLTPEPVLLQGPRRQIFALSAGQFRLDPAKGYTLGRKQLGVAYSVLACDQGMTSESSYNFAKAVGLSISAANPSGDASRPAEWKVDTYTQMQTRDTGSLIIQLDATAANISFAKVDPPVPVDCFVVASMTDHGPGGRAVVTLHRGSLDGDGQRHFPNAGYNEGDGSSLGPYDNGWNTGLAIAPYDSKGASTRLGPPMRITLNDLIATNYVLQEPPKHMDYLPRDTRANPLGIVNLSVNPLFNVTYTDEKGAQVSAAQTDATADTFNQSSEASVGGTVSVGDAKAPRASLTVNETVKFGYAYNEKASSFASTAKTSTSVLTASTNADDALNYALRSVDIFRYRVIGRKTADGKFVYVDISLPRPAAGQAVLCDGSSIPDSYQPTHQNGNALTYPILGPALTARYLPPDIGPFQRPDPATPGKTVTVTAPLSVPKRYFWNGNAESERIAWSQTDVGTSTFEYTKTLSGSSDTNVSYEGNGNYFLLNLKLTASFKTSTAGTHGWTQQTLNSATSSRTQSLLLTKTGGDRTRGYSFLPVFYVTQDGTLKMASATDLTQGVGADWWAGTYAGPDAALNLPYRFLPDGSGFNDQDNARRIRGGFAFYATPSPVTKLLTPVSGAIKPGEKLVLEVRVHNLSLGTSLGYDESGKPKPVQVRFDYIKVDQVSREEIGSRKTIGTVDVTFADPNLADPNDTGVLPPVGGKIIPPRGLGRARIDFDTASLPKDGSRHDYRIYAVVDPNDEIRWRRGDGSIAPQTHVRHTTFAVIRLRNSPDAGVKFKIVLQDKAGATLDTLEHTSTGAGRSAVIQALAQKLQASPAFVAARLQLNPDSLLPTAPGIVISRIAGDAKLKPGGEYRSGIVAPDDSAVYFVPTVTSSDGSATTNNTIVITNDSPAQNKEGWFPLSIMAPAALAQPANTPPRLDFGPRILAIRDAAGHLASDRVELEVNHYATFRIGISATQDAEAGGWVEVYLGNPAAGGRLLGAAQITGAATRGANYVWGDWLLPNTPGTFSLFVRLAGSSEPLQPAMTVTLVDKSVDGATKL